MLKKILENFENKSSLTLTWYWEPFHKTGLSFIDYCEKNQISEEKKEELMNNISVAQAPLKISKIAPHIIDQYGRLMPLDPTERIELTKKLTENDNFFVTSVGELKKNLHDWVPKTENMEEFFELQKFWIDKPQILKRFMSLSPWDRLELIESLFGLTKSHTTLEFQRIDEGILIP